MENIIIVLLLIIIVGGAGYFIYKKKKAGSGCVGCPCANSCPGRAGRTMQKKNT